jgi:hypothetical protein
MAVLTNDEWKFSLRGSKSDSSALKSGLVGALVINT